MANTCACGKPARPGGKECRACHMKRYRSTEKGKKSTRRAHAKWQRSDRGKAWKRAYRKRTFHTLPEEVHELRRAVKRLEEAVAHTAKRERLRRSGEPGSDDAPE